jgi:hypothetical protein
MDRNDYTAANRLAWNEAAPIHKKLKSDQLLESFRQPGYSCLDGIETAQFQEIGLAHKAVAQIGCNNGRELLSVKNMGGVSGLISATSLSTKPDNWQRLDRSSAGLCVRMRIVSRTNTTTLSTWCTSPLAC